MTKSNLLRVEEGKLRLGEEVRLVPDHTISCCSHQRESRALLHPWLHVALVSGAMSPHLEVLYQIKTNVTFCSEYSIASLALK